MKAAYSLPFVPHEPSDAFWVGTNIFRLRRKKGMTQEALAKAANISARRLRDIEDVSAEINVTLETVSALARALGVETVALFKHHKDADHIQV